ncbi:UDP-N-acetylmuramate--L-alanyl-gamma-D-glutamyl-meso-2,6-diaminoheptanedioate ligase [Gammaproteobacteria bacterium]
MHLHILGICGTFMGGIALLARSQGHVVTGSDAHVYPPMSTQLAAAGITLQEGYDPAHLAPLPDVVMVGNAISRGNPLVEYVLDIGLPYVSGPEWLARYVLQGRWVLAVAGTHGKTTTTSLLAWILEAAGCAPGFLIGGVPENFGVSARLTDSPLFVVEADEYDTAFFDKRSKFVHYRPRTVILNNLEYDHADIFPDLAAIQRQFHHLVRTVPRSGLILAPAADAALNEVLAMGRWTPLETFGAPDAAWQARPLTTDGSRFEVILNGKLVGRVEWELLGIHNIYNALAAIAAARHAGVAAESACAALPNFRNVKRRLEMRGCIAGVTVYDDFAHHPTAVAVTLGALRARVGQERILAVLEPRSNTMRLGVHQDTLAPSLAAANQVFLYQPPNLGWNLDGVIAGLDQRGEVHFSIDALVSAIVTASRFGDHVLIMSNGGFDGIHDKLLVALAEAAS